jgi:hypothetical protein
MLWKEAVPVYRLYCDVYRLNPANVKSVLQFAAWLRQIIH